MPTSKRMIATRKAIASIILTATITILYYDCQGNEIEREQTDDEWCADNLTLLHALLNDNNLEHFCKFDTYELVKTPGAMTL
jgi:hypothetical protein